jgi:hypothetical protein
MATRPSGGVARLDEDRQSNIRCAFLGRSGRFRPVPMGVGFSLATDLRAVIPDVADAVISGEPVAPPAYRLYLAATREDRSAIMVLPRSVNVTAPPFAISLLWPRLVGLGVETTMFDTGLLARARAKTSVKLTLPIITTLVDEGEWFPVLNEPMDGYSASSADSVSILASAGAMTCA